MGRPMPGFAVALVDATTGAVVPVDGSGQPGEGEICLDLRSRPVSLMTGYDGDDELTAAAMAGGYYHTGDVGSVDVDGYVTYVGRADDVFKPRIIVFLPSSSNRFCSSTNRSQRRRSCPHRIPSDWPCRRHTWCWRQDLPLTGEPLR